MSFMKKYQVTIFFVVTLGISALIAAIAYSTDNEGLSILAVLSPTLTALVLTAATTGWQGIKDLTVGHVIRRFEWRWLLLSVLLFPAIVVLLQTAFLGAPFQLAHTDIMPYVIVVFVISIGEEFGWRAYAMPRLMERYSILVSGAIVGIFWALWHYPGALIGQGTPESIPFYIFMFWVVGVGVLMGWIYARTRSVVPAILMHSSSNFSFVYSSLLPDGTDSLWPFILMTGIVWLIVGALLLLGKLGSPKSVAIEA